jgi:multicomponent Na+:H+ antiporter subunit C
VEVVLAVVVGGVYAAGVYMMLRRRLAQIIIGLALLTNAANLLIFTAAGLVPHQPPVIPPDAETLQVTSADPLPQALILTAIVIGFGILAFALVLAYRTYHVVGTDDLDDMRSTDQ